tara:strand:- start:294 stop:494 length:201 start_codon:yes stop_codon:yes gene_type:complete
MAKYEIVKETSFLGDVLYSIEKEGRYISNSCSSDLNRVESYLKSILENGTHEKVKETVKTIEVNEN